MSDNWYDIAQICTYGHVINSQTKYHPEHNKKFCDKCGAPTITHCQNCNAPIKGLYHRSSDAMLHHPTDLALPSFCPDCGKPYPWTEAKLKAAQELADELDNLSAEERDMLKKSLADIVRDTPQTTVAATRFKRLISKATAKGGKFVADSFRDILVDIVSEAAKKLIWP